MRSIHSLKENAFLSFATILVLSSTLVPLANAKPTSGKADLPSVTQTVNQNKVKKIGGNSGPGPKFISSSSLYSYRQDWGYRTGESILTLNWSIITANSNVQVSVHECGISGSARYQVHNVTPQAGRVVIRTQQDWPSNIKLCADYLVVS